MCRGGTGHGRATLSASAGGASPALIARSMSMTVRAIIVDAMASVLT